MRIAGVVVSHFHLAGFLVITSLLFMFQAFVALSSAFLSNNNPHNFKGLSYLPPVVSTSTLNRPLLSTAMSSSSSSSMQEGSGDIRFGKFVIPSASVFYRSSPSSSTKSFAFVNLRPIVPGHVLVVPEPVIPLMEELSDDAYDDLWRTVRVVQRILKKAYPNATAFNVAVQDGLAAGQSVPHVHVHILPRCLGDYERNDDIYGELDTWAPRDELKTNTTQLQVAADNERKDRTPQQMANEAAQYRAFVVSRGNE